MPGSAMYLIGPGILLVFAAISLFNHIRYGRTVFAAIAELLLFIVKDRSSEAETRKQLELKAQSPEKQYTPPLCFRKKYPASSFMGMPLYHIGRSDTAPIVIYLHGGAYVSQMLYSQWRMLERISARAECEIISIIYPLAPHHTWEDSFDKVSALYISLRERYPRRAVILMGDSAGGGLSLALAQDIHSAGIRMPDALILLSPWVRAYVDPEIAEQYTRIDPMLSAGRLNADAAAWAGDESIEDRHISPINGSFDGLDHVYLFAGTREMFFPDIVLLHQKLKEQCIHSELYIGKGLNHVFPAYPIPEAISARKSIAAIIERFNFQK